MKKLTKISALLLVLVIAIGAGIVGISAAESDTAEVGADSNVGITIYYKCEDTTPYIYYWNALPKNIESAYPGVKMTKDTTQGEDWYKFTFKDSSKINFIFTDGTDTLEGQLSKEFTRTTGEWWLKNGRWKDKNPEIHDDLDFDYSDLREDTIYFVITTRFFDGDSGNNVHCWDDGKAQNPDSDPAWRGDFKGLAEKLDYIKALGFSAVWITPVVENASGYDYHGYHAMDFSKVDSRYESDDYTYQDLINDAHDKGMKIIQDVVWQHTGNFGEAFFCNLFEKDYSADLSDLEASMVPTDYLLNSFGLSSPEEYWSQKPKIQYDQRLNLMKNTASAAGANNTTGGHPDDADYGMEKMSTDAKYNSHNYYHTGYFQSLNWDDWTCKYCQIAGDCVDLNTENPAVAKYLVDCYSDYIAMGVDAFRVDTVRHISRLSLNMMYNDQLNNAAKELGNDYFYMFGEICCRYSQTWYRDHACESVQFYTWDESDPSYKQKWNFDEDATAEEINENMNLTFDHYRQFDDVSKQPTSDNAFLNGVTYHTPDYSQNSGMGAIDFQMHWCFDSADGAFGIAKSSDKYFNDATWNVVYVESHDYAPDRGQGNRFAGGTQTWAENMSLMFTFRGIPCLYYGGEVEFQKGVQIDVGPNAPLAETGRAYFGDYLEGTVTATDFSEYTATGTVADTLNSHLAKHLTKLNAIRRAVPALQKGQYTTDSKYVSGNMAYIRRFTDADVDSLALVTVSGSATFKNIPNGKYVDAVTGDVQTVTNGTLTATCSGKGNLRVYVCCASGFDGIDGVIGETGLTYIK